MESQCSKKKKINFFIILLIIKMSGLTNNVGFSYNGLTNLTSGNFDSLTIGGTSFTSPYTGATGATGYTGYTGSTGYTGRTGYTGYTGSTGYTGYTGYTGTTGFTGYTGYTGYTGTTGYTGPTGTFNPNGTNFADYPFWNSFTNSWTTSNSFNPPLDNNVYLGNSSGQQNNGSGNSFIGFNSGFNGANQNSVSIGNLAGQKYLGNSSISIGDQAGNQNTYTETFVCGGGGTGPTGTIGTSSNPTSSWTNIAYNGFTTVLGVAYGLGTIGQNNGVWVTCGTVSSGNNVVAYSTNNASTFTGVSIASNTTWNNVNFTNGVFFGGNTAIYVSSNGSSWSNVTTLASNDTFQCASYNPNDLKYYVGTYGGGGSSLYSSTTLSSFTSVISSSTVYAIYASTYIQQLQSLFIVGQSTKTTPTLSVLYKSNTSSSFINSTVTSSGLNQGFCIAYSLNGNIIVVGGTSTLALIGTGNVMAYSTDQGKTFTATSTTNLTTYKQINGIMYDINTTSFYAVGTPLSLTSTSKFLLTSSDGINWTVVSNSTLGYGDKIFLNTVYPNSYTTSIGYQSGYLNQTQYGISIGYQSGYQNQGNSAVSIGYQAGYSNQGYNSVSIGYQAGCYNQSGSSVSIGQNCGFTGQAVGCTAVGYNSGSYNQGQSSVAIGIACGYTGQSTSCVAVGSNSGYANQGQNAISIGLFAGQSNQGVGAIAIGAYSSQTGQGAYSIAIGSNCINGNQQANSICINATNSQVSQPNSSSCIITPVRQVQYASAPSVPFTPSANDNLVYYPGGSEVIRNPCVSFLVRLQGYGSATINSISTTAWTCNTAPQLTFDNSFNNGLYNGKLNTSCYHVLNCGSSTLNNTNICSFVVPQTGIYNVSLSLGQSLQTNGLRIVVGLNNNGSTTEIIDYLCNDTTLDQINWSESMQLVGGWYVFPYCVTTPNFAVGNFSAVLIVPTY